MHMKKTKDIMKPNYIGTYRKVIPYIYRGLILIMMLLVFLNWFLKDKKTMTYGLGNYIGITDQWTDEEGNAFDFMAIDRYVSEDDKTVSIYYTLPEKISTVEQIVYRSKNVSTVVYVDGKIKYQTDIVNAPFYSMTPGTRWNVLTFTEEDSGKTITMDITLAYLDGRCKVDNVYMGDATKIVIDIIKKKFLGLLISILLAIIGIIYLIGNLIINWKRKKSERDNSLLHLAACAIITAIWGLLETNVFQFFIAQTRQMQLINSMALCIGGLSLYLFMDDIFEIFQHRIFRYLCVCNLGYIMITTILHVFHIRDFHQMSIISVFGYGIESLILVWCVFHDGMTQHKDLKRKKEHKISHLLELIAMISVGVGLIGDSIRFFCTDVLDRAYFIRIGLLVFILCFGAGNIYRILQLTIKGNQAELISKLAYQDGLTKIGNRTAYTERIEEMAKKPFNERVGLILFDINNLKYVNDHMGHTTGDDMICTSVEVIEKTFGLYGEAYRIGGDEFVVLLVGADLEQRYQDANEKFHCLMQEYNQSGAYKFLISIAHGYAEVENSSVEGFELAEQHADQMMYRNKKEMKEKLS